MDDKRDRTQYPSGEPGSPYSDAYYEKAPETKRSCYGYNVAQCYARASGEPEPPETKKKPQGVGLMILGLAALFCVLAITLFSAGGVLLSDSASAAVEHSREIYEEYSASREENGELAVVNTAGPEARELTAEEIYNVACRCTVGVTVPGYAYNVFGQAGDSVVMGSGIVLSEDGYILTNYHVIEKAYESGADIMVIDFDGASYPAETVGIEEDSDLAVLKIEAENLTPAELGDSSALRVGQTIYAVGNPLGELTYTMTSGIVSALDRHITTDVNVTMNMFQIDAAVNNGNSGGPVFNVYGQVIGVVTAKYTLYGMEGLGFAIPADDACRIASDLVEKGYVAGKAYLGLTLASVSPSAARYYDMVPGVYIYDVEAGSCSEKAGLAVGDVITAIDGAPVADTSELAKAVKGYYNAGDSAELTVWRDQEYLQITVVFDEELPAAPEPGRQTGASADIIIRRG